MRGRTYENVSSIDCSCGLQLSFFTFFGCACFSFLCAFCRLCVASGFLAGRHLMISVIFDSPAGI